MNSYFYGPYEQGGHTEVWGYVTINDLPFIPYEDAGTITLDSGKTAVIWIEFTFNCGVAGLVFNNTKFSIAIN